MEGKNIIQNVIKEVRINMEFVKINFLNEAQLRVSFLIQVIGMALNNTSFLIIWLFFFNAFGEINGWSQREVIFLEGFLCFVYGLAFAAGDGMRRLPESINNGSFDSYLTLPRNLYFRILFSKINTSAFGDLLYGLIVLVAGIIIFKISFISVLLMIALFVPTILIMLNFALITSLIGFLIPDGVSVSHNLYEVFFAPTIYPAGLFHGTMRFVFLFILPTLAVAGVPVEVFLNLDMQGFVIVIVLAIFWTFIAQYLLSVTVKKYESGNLVGSR